MPERELYYFSNREDESIGGDPLFSYEPGSREQGAFEELAERLNENHENEGEINFLEGVEVNGNEMDILLDYSIEVEEFHRRFAD